MNHDNVLILTNSKTSSERLYNTMSVYQRFADVRCADKQAITEFPGDWQGVDTIFSSWYMPNFSVEEIKTFFPNLKYLFYAAGAVEYFAKPFYENNVRIFSASLANGISVAEFAASQIILANKGYFQAVKRYRWPIFSRGFIKARNIAIRKFGNYKSKVGIIGCGAVGSSVLRLLKDNYDLMLFACDPYKPEEQIREMGAQPMNLQGIFSSCDVISNHLPDIPSTRGIFDYSLFSTMKTNATFINTGRGKQVVEKDLAKVLHRNKDMCALLDVTSHEPLFPWSPLFKCNNVFISPHIAGSLSHEYERMVEYMVKSYENILDGGNGYYEVFDS